MLGPMNQDDFEDQEEGEGIDFGEDEVEPDQQSKLHPLMHHEKEILERFLQQLNLAHGDPKYLRVLEILKTGVRSPEGVHPTDWGD